MGISTKTATMFGRRAGKAHKRMQQIKLAELTIPLLQEHDSWAVIPQSLDEEDALLVPAEKDESGLIPKTVGELWCRCKVTFFNKERHTAVSMCRGDADENPILWAFWNNQEFVNLLLPPAPDFVLEVEGPDNFCRQFGLPAAEIFPILFEVEPEFQTEPQKRIVLIYADGNILPL